MTQLKECVAFIRGIRHVHKKYNIYIIIIMQMGKESHK